MSFEQLVFYIFSAILVMSASAVVTVRNPVYAALSLVLVFFTCAAIWMMMEAEFLAIVLVLVYVGAVMVLFLFVIMMLDINMTPLREGFIKYLPVGAAIAFIMFLEMAFVVGPDFFGLDVVEAPIRHAADYSNTTELGMVLYTQYVYPFELAAVILLLAIVAAIALTMRGRRKSNKSIDAAIQMRVNAEDRVRVVKMKSEKLAGEE